MDYNFSQSCHLLHGNHIMHETFHIVFLFKKISRKERIMCGSCVKSFGGRIGDPLQIGDIPTIARETGEIYQLCQGYPLMAERLRAHGFQGKIEFILAEIDDFSEYRNNLYIKNPLKLTPKLKAHELETVTDYILWGKNAEKHPVRLSHIFDIKPLSKSVKVDHRTIIHTADYNRFAKRPDKLQKAGRLAVSRRYPILDMDIKGLRQSSDFVLENPYDMALAIAPKYVPPFLQKTNNEKDVLEFLFQHEDIIMSLKDAEGHPLFLNFKLASIQDEDMNDFLDEFLGCYFAEFDGVDRSEARLYKTLPITPRMPRMRAVVYGQHLLPLGVYSLGGNHLGGLIHDPVALPALKEITENLRRALPFSYFGIDYRIVRPMGQKPYFVLKGIDILKSFDLSYIAFAEKKYKNQINRFYQRLPGHYKGIFARDIWDQLVCSPFRTLLSQYARTALDVA